MIKLIRTVTMIVAITSTSYFLNGARPPAPKDYFSALCEIVPANDHGARYTAYCDVLESPNGVIIRYDIYPDADIPHLRIASQDLEVQHSLQYVPGHFPFMRFEIPGWGQTIIYPVSLDLQAEYMVRAKDIMTREILNVSWIKTRTNEYTLTIIHGE